MGKSFMTHCWSELLSKERIAIEIRHPTVSFLAGTVIDDGPYLHTTSADGYEKSLHQTDLFSETEFDQNAHQILL